MLMSVTSTFASRLLEAVADAGIPEEGAYAHAGVKRGTWHTWVGTRQSVPKGDALVKLASRFNVRPEWLATGKGPKKAMQPTFTQAQIDVAEAWPYLSSQTQAAVADLIRAAAISIEPGLAGSLINVDTELQERANRLLEEAQSKNARRVR